MFLDRTKSEPVGGLRRFHHQSSRGGGCFTRKIEIGHGLACTRIRTLIFSAGMAVGVQVVEMPGEPSWRCFFTNFEMRLRHPVRPGW